MTNIEPLKQEVHDLRNLLMGAMHALEEVAREAQVNHVRNIAEKALGEIENKQKREVKAK